LGAELSHPRILGALLGVVQEQNFLGVYRTHQIPNFKKFWNKINTIPKLGGLVLTPEFGNGFWPKIHLKNTETANLPLSAILEDESRMMMSADHKPWQRKDVSDSTRKAMLRV
jgi:hypothetical protein